MKVEHERRDLAPMKTNVALAIVILAIAAIPRQAAEPIGRHGWWVGI